MSVEHCVPDGNLLLTVVIIGLAQSTSRIRRTKLLSMTRTNFLRATSYSTGTSRKMKFIVSVTRACWCLHWLESVLKVGAVTVQMTATLAAIYRVLLDRTLSKALRTAGMKFRMMQHKTLLKLVSSVVASIRWGSPASVQCNGPVGMLLLCLLSKNLLALGTWCCTMRVNRLSVLLMRQ